MKQDKSHQDEETKKIPKHLEDWEKDNCSLRDRAKERRLRTCRHDPQSKVNLLPLLSLVESILSLRQRESNDFSFHSPVLFIEVSDGGRCSISFLLWVHHVALLSFRFMMVLSISPGC